MDGEIGSLIELKGEDFYCPQEICPSIDPTTDLAFYKDIGMECDAEKLEKLFSPIRQQARSRGK